jgi:putative restriction endonuclease
MMREELLGRLTRLRVAPVGGKRAPHKPLLLLWLFGRLVATATTKVSYLEAQEPVSQLINDYGPAVGSAGAAKHRAAMPFIHLERQLWDLRDAAGHEIGPDAPERGPWLLDAGAVGQLRPPVEALLADISTLAAAARLLLDLHFTPALEPMICGQAGLDLPALEATGPGHRTPVAARRPRVSGFAEAVLRAYAYQCAMCGFDGRLGRNPVAIQAAHVHWHSRGGPDAVANALALCALHHVLFDLGVVGITPDHHITVAPDYVATTSAGRAVDGLAGQPILDVRPGQSSVDIVYIDWHRVQVFKGDHRAALSDW